MTGNVIIPWSEYPRPRMVRDSYISLNGEWDFAYAKSIPESFGEKIAIPFPPESKLSGIKRAHTDDELLYYRRSFVIPEGFIKSKVILHLGAVDQIFDLTVNRKYIGHGEGGYLPHSFDITDAVSEGENEILIEVTDTLSNIYPYGKQKEKRGGMWYTPISGIWQSVWIESLPEDAILDVRVSADTEKATIEVITDSDDITLVIDGAEVARDGKKFTVTPSEKNLWTPDSPYLYYFSIKTETDEVRCYFALRSIGIGDFNGVKRLTLNGEPYLFNGLLDQGYFPDGIYLPADYKGYEKDILTAKELGFNTLRKHIKIEPEIFYHLCDKLGMIVFQDMVNNSGYSFVRDTALPTIGMKRFPDKFLHRNKRSREIFIDTMKKTMEHLYSYPSVLYYTIFNEGWGQFNADEAYSIAKQIDDTRIIDSTSGWFWQKKSDVDSHHIYFKKLMAKANAKRPVVISEFGGYSLRVAGHLFGEKNYGYKTFENEAEFEDAVVKLYENEALPLVESCVSALIYTQVSDVEDETNGFMTYDREVLKVNPDRIKETNKKLEKAIK